jgi:hypothetical protein
MKPKSKLTFVHGEDAIAHESKQTFGDSRKRDLMPAGTRKVAETRAANDGQVLTH